MKKVKKHPKHWSRALSLFLTVFMAVQLITPAVAVQAQPTMEDELVAESILQDETETAQTEEETQPAEETQTAEEILPVEEAQNAEKAQPEEVAQPAEEPQEEVSQSEETSAPAEESAEPQVLAAEVSQYEYVEVTKAEELTSGDTYAIVYTTSAAAAQGNIMYHANRDAYTDQVTARFTDGKMNLDDTNRFPEKTQTWIITKVEGGYTIQSCSADNQYLNLNKITANTQGVPVSGNAQTLTIKVVDGGVQITGTADGQTFYLDHEETGRHHVSNDVSTMRLFKRTKLDPLDVSKTALKNAIKKAEALVVTDYTDESKAALEAAVAAGHAELKREDSTEASVAKATAAINQAIQAMVPKADLMAPDHPTPATGTTVGEPFPAGIGGSETFRIPALITLNDGSVAAAIDARWDECPDGFSIDTLFSRSTDGGKTWNYNFPNYFNDSVDKYWGGGKNKGNAASFIDPVMVQDNNGTIYLMTDVFPGGTFILSTLVNSGYEVVDGVERLAIHYSPNGKPGTYDFYVGDFTKADGEKTAYAPLIARGDDTMTAAYYVDDHYNLYTANKQPMYCQQLGTHEQPWSGKYVQQNVFYYNAEVHVRKATYLWMVTSDDNGQTWSAPTIMNPMVRTRPAQHRFYGVGPGAGLCLDDGTVMLPCYAHAPERSSFIYKNPGETIWHRSQDASKDTSSESTLVQIDKDTVRQFCRDEHNVLRYTDHKRNADGQWLAQPPVRVENVPKTTMNQLSALRYSKEINGKPVILVSTAATGSGVRQNGKIYAFNLENDEKHSMTHIGTYEVNKPGEVYGYSSLTELPDGSISLLYEDTWIHATYKNILLNEIIPDAIVNGKRTVKVTMYDTKEDPFKFQTLPTEAELAQMDSTIATGKIVDGKVVYTGVKAGETSYTTGGVTVVVRVTEPANVQEVPLTVGQSEEIAVENSEIRLNSNSDAVAAKITVDDKSQTVTGGQCHIGTDAHYNGELKPLAMGLHVFEKTDDGFQVFGKDADGRKVWLNPAGSIGAPISAEPVQVQFEQQTDGSFFIKSGSRYLAFWRNGKYEFDAGTNPNGDLYKFKLYRPATADEQSSPELPGYVQVTKLENVQDGGMYLIVAAARNDNYLLWPSLDSGSKHAHAAKADKNEKNVTYTVDNKYYTLTLTGKAVGTSDVVVGDVVYRVNVTCEHEFGTEWQHDGTNHWHECSCGAKQDEAAHTYGDWTVTKQPTESATGLKVHSCTVCGYEETVEIPVVPVDPDVPVNPNPPVDPDTPATPDTPTNPTTPDQGVTPPTGDSSQVILWVVMFTISGLCLAAVAVWGKKKYHS